MLFGSRLNKLSASIKFGGGAVFTPLSLFASSEEGAWYDPSDLTSLAQNSDGTGAVTVGDPVGYMADKSGNGNHATQATASRRPILRQTVGGEYYLEFDGVDDYLDSTTLSSSVLDGGGFIGASWLSSSTSNHGVFEERETTTKNRVVIYGRNTFNLLLNYSPLGNQNSVSTSGLLTTNQPFVSVGNSDGATITGRLDGSVLGTATSSENFNSSTFFSLGRQSIGSLFLDGHIYGAVSVSRELTASEILDIEAYLADKSGVTL